jgi:predicted AAA+ superfamily ATPase
LEPLRGLVVLDEVQRKPALFELLRVLADRRGTPARFLILGSASPDLVRGVSESLAGRVRFVDMGGFSLAEVGARNGERLWLRGGFPRAFLAPSEERSRAWRGDFIRSFLERDIPQLGISVPAAALRRFWVMVAHYHGQVWNAAEFARSLGSSEPTARRYLDLLAGAFVVRLLSPWHENVSKRQVKAPKVYVRDTGLLHALLGLGSRRDLLGHPKVGASWEGFVIEQILSEADPREAYFWATHSGAELDLLLFRKGARLGFEVKFTDAPRVTKSMQVAKSDLRLRRLYVVYPGPRSFRLGEGIEALSLHDLSRALRQE